MNLSPTLQKLASRAVALSLATLPAIEPCFSEEPVPQSRPNSSVAPTQQNASGLRDRILHQKAYPPEITEALSDQELKNAQNYFQDLLNKEMDRFPQVNIKNLPIFKHLFEIARNGLGLEIEDNLGRQETYRFYDRPLPENYGPLRWIHFREILVDMKQLEKQRENTFNALGEFDQSRLLAIVKSRDPKFDGTADDARNFLADYVTAWKMSSSWFYALSLRIDSRAIDIDCPVGRIKEISAHTEAVALKSLSLAFISDPYLVALEGLLKMGKYPSYEADVGNLYGLIVRGSFGTVPEIQSRIIEESIPKDVPTFANGRDKIMSLLNLDLRKIFFDIKEGEVAPGFEINTACLNAIRFMRAIKEKPELFEKLKQQSESNGLAN